MRGKALAGWALALALAFSFTSQAHAERVLLRSEAVQKKGVPGGSLDGACGIAMRAGLTYVSDYYHHAIDAFSFSGGEFQSQLPFSPLDGPCQLSFAPGGALYANEWHEGVSRVLPTALSFDSGESTGVAVDQATGRVYVDDRTYVAVYDSSGTPVLVEGQPLKIGLGGLGDAYGLALFGGKLYVPDASDHTVKVFEPALDSVDPVTVIDGSATPQQGFNSLVDAAVAVDPTNGHLIVLDNLKPGFEHPEAALDEFDSKGSFLGQLATKVIDGGPSGLAFSSANLFVTSGNSVESKVLEFGPYTALAPSESALPGQQPSSQPLASPAPSSGNGSAPGELIPLTQATTVQRGGIKVSFEGKLAPRKLPRHGSRWGRRSRAPKEGNRPSCARSRSRSTATGASTPPGSRSAPKETSSRRRPGTR